MKRLLKFLFPKWLLNLRHLFFAWWGARKYGYPSEELYVIGITGTSGKSSTAYWLRKVLEDLGYTVGALTTIEFAVAGETKLNDKKMTMLGKTQIQEYLRKMVNKKCDIAIVETTSEGRLQYRHKFINYDMMILTNLYPEHIESHGSFENYKQAKKDIFSYVSKLPRKQLHGTKLAVPTVPKSFIVNDDSEYADEFLQFSAEEKMTFGRENKEAMILGHDIVTTAAGLSFSVEGNEFSPKIYGEYNVMNLLTVISVCRQLDVDWRRIQEAVNKLTGAPGRVEFIPEAEKNGFQVIVDYAFEPVAIKALYDVVKLLDAKRIIHVFGSTGGGRDKARRFTVGEFVGKHADVCIVTDEDPYEDDPREIMDGVASAVKKSGKTMDKDLFIIEDRKEAIANAVGMAQEGDIVLVTGKGSEQAMCVAGGKMIPWDDREFVRQSL